jgi:GMP synthase (glutamine-hydrolysing)
MVSQELKWSLELEKYIQKISSKNIPLLGICYGHQLIAKALGGKSGFNKKGLEIGRVKIKCSKKSLHDPLFKNLPKIFYAYETHYQSAIKLPTRAIILASNMKDTHQAVRFTKYIWGVQFHPEFDENIMKEYIINQKDALSKNCFSVDNLLKNTKNCNMSHKILSNFMNIVQDNKNLKTKNLTQF